MDGTKLTEDTGDLPRSDNAASPLLLTLGVYTHVELPDRSAAIESLPAPPQLKPQDGEAGTGKSDRAAST